MSATHSAPVVTPSHAAPASHSTTPVTVAHANEPTTSPLIQVSGALLGIIVLILAAAWVIKRVLPGTVQGRSSSGLKVSASASLGARERVVIVNVEDARLVLGVTAQQVTLLHTLPPAPPENPPPQANAPEFASLMKNMLKRPGRS
ncbi:flagellar biosynthetic protein FliO [Kluyvera sp. CRP]|uniref:flagellar biosynthetic protein FliO n=1 Tax=Kluyvera sp. CRP TaxID=2873269 RepID=UPI001CC1DBF2|nr:flagellar biosynthetic protein FliO [Kluyvera sp. CRP]UAK19590.1 flagellar biosynthetic protein FliO [Kluyvera sp. CRP]